MRRSRQPLQSQRRRLTVEQISLIIGFVLSIGGLAAAQFYQRPSSDRLQATVQHLDETWAHLKIIHSAQALLGLLQSFESLVFLVPADFDRNKEGADAIADVMNRAIHGRHEAMENYFAQVASTGLIDYETTMKRYQALIAAETADWSLKTYTATNSLPSDLSMQVGSERWRLEASVIPQENAFFQLLGEVSLRAWLVTLLGAAGSGIIFVLALMEAGGRSVSATAHDPLPRAVDLMQAALEETHRRLAAAQLGDLSKSS
jgi:hypothetical protein